MISADAVARVLCSWRSLVAWEVLSSRMRKKVARRERQGMAVGVYCARVGRMVEIPGNEALSSAVCSDCHDNDDDSAAVLLSEDAAAGGEFRGQGDANRGEEADSPVLPSTALRR